MHEMYLIKDLFSGLLDKAKANKVSRVTKVYLKMGEFTEINEEIIRFFFNQKSIGTIIEGAELLIEISPNRELRLISFDCE